MRRKNRPIKSGVGLGLGLGVGGGGFSYYIRDAFSTDRAVGSVNNTAAEPGPGLRNVVDSDSRITVTGGVFNIAANAGGTSGWERTGKWYTPAITRLPGIVLAGDVKYTVSVNGLWGFTINANTGFAGFNKVGLQIASTPIITARGTSDGTSPYIFVPTTNVTYRIYIVLRSTGRYVFLKTGGVTKLLWIDAWDGTGTLYAGMTIYNKEAALTLDDIKVIKSIVYSTLASSSDSFNRADGAPGNTDGAGHAEANSGDGLAWVNSQGTGAIASNVLTCSALDGDGKGILTVDTGKKDEIATVEVTRVGDLVGCVVRYINADNYIYAWTDGTNAGLKQRLETVETDIVAAAAITYAAGKELRVSCDGTTFWLYYNQLYVGRGTSATAPTGTKHGVYTTNIGNSFNNWFTFPRGNNSEYADLGNH